MMQRIPTALVALVSVAILAIIGGCAFEPGDLGSRQGGEGTASAQGSDGQPIGAGDAIQMAGNAKALATLTQAKIAAQVYLSEMGTFESFSVSEAQMREPNITWNASPFALEDQVSIRDAQAGSVVLVYHPGIGDAICAVVDAADVTVRYGQADAATAGACVGEVPGFEDINTGPLPQYGDPYADPYAGQDAYVSGGSLTGP